MGFSWWGEGPTIQPRQRVREIIDRLQGERRRDTWTPRMRGGSSRLPGAEAIEVNRTQAEYIILDVLVLNGDVLTACQLATKTGLSTEAVREALLGLHARGLATAPAQGAGWVATDRGRDEWSSHPERRPDAK